MGTPGTFLYFAYGSNLLTKRIHLNNPSAVRVNIGKLDDYSLDFITQSQRWKGASATIVPKNGSHIWGALWEISEEHLSSLDCQEGVADKIYFPLYVDVTTPQGDRMKPRIYQQCNNPTDLVPLSELPSDRRPSEVYMRTIIEGAKESKIPPEYIKYLQSIKHNGYSGDPELNLK